MTSPAWVIYAVKGEKTSAANEILWVAAQIGWESFNEFIALPVVGKNKAVCWLLPVSILFHLIVVVLFVSLLQ